MKTISKLMVLLLLAGVCFAKPAASEGEPAAKAHHAKKKVVKKAAVCEACEAIKQLKEQIQAQQAEIDQLKSAQPQAAVADQKATAAAAEAAAAQQQAAAAAAAAADANNKANAAQSDVSGLKTTVDTTVAEVQKDTKRVNELEEPAFIHYKGVKITPGGYAQFATIWRQRNANSDTADNYGQYPFPNSPDYHMSEFRATGRASRLSLKIEGAAHDMKFMDYTEIDFLGSAGGNETQTNSFAPRLRLAFANVDFKGGWSIAGGQNWSMIQTTRKGIDPLSEWLPSLIDNSYTPGFSYAREGSIRVVKQITPKAWFGFSVENPDTVVGAACTSSTQCNFNYGEIQGLANAVSTASPNNGYSNTISGADAINGNPSVNIAPDLVAKLAFEPGWGHYEVKYIARWFRDRVYPDFFNGATVSTFIPPNNSTTGTQTSNNTTTNTVGAHNNTTEGGGIGFGMILPVVKNKVDVDFQGLAGAGIGRFGTTSGPDVTINPLGKLVPVKGVQMVAGIETHPTPKFDFNIYGGGDYYKRASYTLAAGQTFFGAPLTKAVEEGYGYQYANDSTCNTENATAGLPTSTTTGLETSDTDCSGNTKMVWAIQPQLWYRLYKGKAGTVQFGASYAYVWREAWSGRGPNAAGNPVVGITGLVNPKTINQIVMTSFRYYIP
jgi:hypothetical protein